MQHRINRYGKAILPLLSVLSVSFLGGFTNGLLGTGGGIVLLWLLGQCERRICGARFLPMREEDGKNAFASVLVCILPLSLFTAVLYRRNGVFDGFSFVQNAPYLLGALPGGMLGAWLLDRLKLTAVSLIFAALLIFSGFRMAF